MRNRFEEIRRTIYTDPARTRSLSSWRNQFGLSVSALVFANEISRSHHVIEYGLR
jgi:hypothetical protein